MRLNVLVLATMIWPACVFAENSYLVQSKISVAGVERAAPGLAVVDSRIGMVSIGGNLDLALVASGLENNQILVSSLLVIDGVSHRPAVLLELGKRASVSIGETEISFLVSEFKKSS